MRVLYEGGYCLRLVISTKYEGRILFKPGVPTMLYYLWYYSRKYGTSFCACALIRSTNMVDSVLFLLESMVRARAIMSTKIFGVLNWEQSHYSLGGSCCCPVIL